MPDLCEEKDRIPTVIDLFSGVGGFSLGAARARFKVVAAVDADERAMKAYSTNFPRVTAITERVEKLTGESLLEKAGVRSGKVTGLIGGPPCQGFSRIGLRNSGDRRNSLFFEFFRIVSETQPTFYVVENVPGILDSTFEKVRREALSLARGYVQIPPVLLKASEFGVPTSRERVFFVGYRPRNFRKFAIEDLRPRRRHRIVTVREALVGLPRKIDVPSSSGVEVWSRLRNSPRGSYGLCITNHIPEGVGCEKARRKLREFNLVSGSIGTAHQPETVERFSLLGPGEIDSVSRARRLELNGLCPTLRAGTGPERGSYQALRPIHPNEPRAITPREAARLQGFPDWFQFDATKWHSFRFIGNSVSPAVAEHLLKSIRTRMKGEPQ